MRFKQIVIENLGPFAGPHRLQLTGASSDNGDSPVVVVVGKNGSGKTTILDAIRLCLFGKAALGPRVRESDYHKFIRARLHRKSGQASAGEARVTVEIDRISWGLKESYRVMRSWYVTQSRVRERLRIEAEDGSPLRESLPEHWQSFLNELVPIGVADFFLFDGEKIQRLAERNGSGHHLRDAIRRLLGLDVVDRLQTDLRIYVRQVVRNGSSESLEAEIEALEAKAAALDEVIAEEQGRLDGARANVGRILEQIEIAERELASHGGDYARQRESLAAEKARHEEQFHHAEEGMRELAAGLLPFSFVPALAVKLKDALTAERESRWLRSSQEFLSKHLPDAAAKIESSCPWDELGGAGISTEARHSFVLKISELVRRELAERSATAHDLVHDLSDNDTQRALNWVEEATERLPARARGLATVIEDITQKRQQIEELLAKAPNEELLKPMVDKVNGLHVELGKAEKDVLGREERVRSHLYERDNLQRKLDALHNRLTAHEGAQQKVSLAERVMSVAGRYSEEAARAKLDVLGERVSECLRNLVHKDSLFGHVEIDPETYEDVLFDKCGREVRKETLSAGEKQLYAIALLWGLSKSSGKQLPVIIDTPLGRLDQAHRRSLLTRYFPYASQHVMLLGTDSELDSSALEQLSPYLSRMYSLHYDSGESQSVVREERLVRDAR